MARINEYTGASIDYFGTTAVHYGWEYLTDLLMAI
jgi:hypothetical protein